MLLNPRKTMGDSPQKVSIEAMDPMIIQYPDNL